MIYDVIIIGAGTMGIATAAEAARRDAAVLALDQFSVPNTMSSHHGGARMFRTSYYEHPDYVPLLRTAFDGWKRLEDETKRELFHVTGGIYLGREDGELIRGAMEAGRLHGLDIQRVDAATMASRFPAFRVPDGMVGLFESAAGVLRCEACIEAMAAVARDKGATLGTNERVEAIRPGDVEVVVETDRARYRGRSVVIAAGAWTGKLLSGLKKVSGLPELTPTRQVIAWLKPEPAHAASFGVASGFPCWAIEDAPGSLHYGFPVLPGDRDLRIARHHRGPTADPDAMDRKAAAGETDELFAYTRGLLPEAGELSRTGVCLYTNSVDSHFIIDRLPGSDNIFVACGFSGHGFKFAPVMGQVLADLALEGETEHAIEFLGLARFSK